MYGWQRLIKKYGAYKTRFAIEFYRARVKLELRGSRVSRFSEKMVKYQKCPYTSSKVYRPGYQNVAN